MSKRDQLDRTEQEIMAQLMYCALDLRDFARANQRDDLVQLSHLLESCALQIESPAMEIKH